MTDEEIAAAWAAIHEALPKGWRCGHPSYNRDRRAWQQYAYDPFEVQRLGTRSREWMALGDSGPLSKSPATCRRLGTGRHSEGYVS